MKVNIEVQSLSDRNFRGIPYYVKNLIEQLAINGTYEYSGTFFDYQGLRENYKIIKEHIDKDIFNNIRLYENNDKDYRKFRENALLDRRYAFEKYTDFFSIKADVYHFPHSNSFGYILPEKSVVTVNDIIPIIYRGKGYFTKEYEERFAFSQNYLREREDIQIIAISETTKTDLCTYLNISSKRIHVVHDAYDKVMCFPEMNSTVLKKYKIKTPYILYVGALDPRKGIDDIITSYKIITEKYADISLVIVGKEEKLFLDNLKKLRVSNFEGKVIITGYVSDDEKRALYSSAEMFLFPSRYEGFGIPILEAMACGCPVITTNVSSLPEVGGNAAIYVEPNNVEMLVNEIEKLLVSEERKSKFQTLGLERAEKFSWKKTAQDTEKVYGIALNS